MTPQAVVLTASVQMPPGLGRMVASSSGSRMLVVSSGTAGTRGRCHGSRRGGEGRLRAGADLVPEEDLVRAGEEGREGLDDVDKVEYPPTETTEQLHQQLRTGPRVQGTVSSQPLTTAYSCHRRRHQYRVSHDRPLRLGKALPEIAPPSYCSSCLLRFPVQALTA